jgi:hypothetical protein
MLTIVEINLDWCRAFLLKNLTGVDLFYENLLKVRTNSSLSAQQEFPILAQSLLKVRTSKRLDA